MKSRLFSLCLLLFMGVALNAQVTTSSLLGKVVDSTGETLIGATVIATHTPSGTEYGATTNLNGVYQIINMRIGGPYTVSVSYIGYSATQQENVFLQLGSASEVNFELREEGIEMSEVVVIGQKDLQFSSRRTGANTNVSESTINALPTISRSINDFARLTPQASTRGNGISFAGTNNRYNQFSIDGTVNNDVFGLAASGTNGGQTGTQPISLDAISQISVELAPYDVKMGGFTGGGINAVTRSGTNKTEGSAYYFVNNQNLTGRSPFEDSDGNRAKLDNYKDEQYGFRLGGPLVKNKLFYFVNAELTARTQPKINGLGQGSNITAEEVNQVLEVVNRVAPGADVGNTDPFEETNNTTKIFGRIDWNISSKHTFSIRHNYVSSENLSVFRNPNTYVLQSGAILFPSTTNTTVAELNSKFSNTVSNELRVGFTSVRDNRTFNGTPFPYVRVDLSGGRNIQLGSEQFSTANQLDQDIFTITDNVTLFKGNHTLTFGTHNEFYSIFNLFIRQNFGSYRYSLNDWLTVGTANETLPVSYDYSYSLVPNEPQWGAEFNAAQLGLYLQDEYRVNDKLKLTAGLRLDVPIFSTIPTANPAFNNTEIATNNDVKTDNVASGNLMWSPRVGFNFDPTGDRKLQFRGGTGIFTGRIPFVWLSNQYSNTGIQIARVQGQSSRGELPEDFTFETNPNGQYTSEDLGKPANTSEINVIDPNFRFAQVWRTSLGIDYRFNNGIVATFDGIYTKNINNILYQNLNVAGLNDGTAVPSAGVDDRPRFGGSFIESSFTDVIYLTNTNEGSSYNLTGQLSKQFGSGLFTSIGYTYGYAKDINAGTSSQAISNWRGVPHAGNPNNPELSFSNFMVPHRLIATLMYSHNWTPEIKTSIGLFYNGQSGVPISFTYDGDANRDRVFGNDLLFVPASRDQVTIYDNHTFQNGAWVVTQTADQQWESLNEFIENDPYLSTRRGQYAERNGARTPFENRFDLRIAQEVGVKGAGRIEVTFDVFNFGNLLNPEWGRSYNPSNTQILTVAQFGRSSGINEPRTINGTEVATPSDRAVYKGNVRGTEAWVENDFFSRWRGQLGVRYTF